MCKETFKEATEGEKYWYIIDFSDCHEKDIQTIEEKQEESNIQVSLIIE